MACTNMELEELIKLKNEVLVPQFSKLEGFKRAGVLVRGKERGIYVIMEKDSDVARKFVNKAAAAYSLPCAYLVSDSLDVYPKQ